MGQVQNHQGYGSEQNRSNPYSWRVSRGELQNDSGRPVPLETRRGTAVALDVSPWLGKAEPIEGQQAVLDHTRAPRPLPSQHLSPSGTWPPRPGACYPAELSSAGPDFDIRPPTPCPAQAATFGFSPDRHSSVACLLTSGAPRGEGHLGPH